MNCAQDVVFPKLEAAVQAAEDKKAAVLAALAEATKRREPVAPTRQSGRKRTKPERFDAPPGKRAKKEKPRKKGKQGKKRKKGTAESDEDEEEEKKKKKKKKRKTKKKRTGKAESKTKSKAKAKSKSKPKKAEVTLEEEFSDEELFHHRGPMGLSTMDALNQLRGGFNPLGKRLLRKRAHATRLPQLLRRCCCCSCSCCFSRFKSEAEVQV